MIIIVKLFLDSSCPGLSHPLMTLVLNIFSEKSLNAWTIKVFHGCIQFMQPFIAEKLEKTFGINLYIPVAYTENTS